MRLNLQIKVGSYAGNNADNRSITGIGFKPDVVLVKGGANSAVIMTNTMKRDSSSFLGSSLVNGANSIQELMADGFQVGGSANVNTTGTTYYYLALRGQPSQRYFKTGAYVGDGTNDRNFVDVKFQPDISIIIGNVAQNKIWRSSSHVGDDSSAFASAANMANAIQSFAATGFQLGTSATVNALGSYYHYLALRKYMGVINCGVYTGNGTDNRSITGVGFQPDFVLVKSILETAQARMRMSTITTDSTLRVAATDASANEIQALEADGFQLGTASGVNALNDTFYWFALKAGDFAVPIVRTPIA